MEPDLAAGAAYQVAARRTTSLPDQRYLAGRAARPTRYDQATGG